MLLPLVLTTLLATLPWTGGASMPEAVEASFAGTWMTTFGPMELKGESTRLRGSYGFDAGAKIDGRVEDGRLDFEWSSPWGNGEGSLELWEDGDVFTGRYTGQGGQRGTWAGYRKRHVLAKPVPGQVVDGQGQCGLLYQVRVPEDWTPGTSAPALVFFHGSNMSSGAYVDTIVAAFPALAADYMLIGVEGEKLAPGSKPGNRFYNYTYVNLSGHGVGEPGRYNQSPGLVAQLLRELDEAYPVERWFVGGHSQGGFLTYAMVMFYPDLVDGAVPMSCNLLVQCEPGDFDDEEHIAKQRRVAIAHVHGENDPLVEYSAAEHCYESMQDGGIEALRLFSHPTAGHMFALLPVEPAVRWLEGVTASDPAELAAFAERCLDEGDARGAIAALRRAEARDADAAVAESAARLWERVQADGADEASRLAVAIGKNADGAWVDDFWEFRRQYAYAPSAEEAMTLYAKLREKHGKPAQDLFYEARGEQDPERRRELLQRILDDYYASRWFRIASRWVEE